jgi:hypothetical protein
MEAARGETLTATRPSVVADLMRFALASLAAGLTTAIAAGALVILLV